MLLSKKLWEEFMKPTFLQTFLYGEASRNCKLVIIQYSD
jgi:hypothetical protein